jgi:hypothetical protein
MKLSPIFFLLLCCLPHHVNAQEVPLLGKLPQLGPGWALQNKGTLPEGKNPKEKGSYEGSWATFTNTKNGDLISFAADRYTGIDRNVWDFAVRQSACDMFPIGLPRFMNAETSGWSITDTLRFGVIRIGTAEALEYSFVYESDSDSAPNRLGHGYVLAFGDTVVFVQHTSALVITSADANSMAVSLLGSHSSGMEHTQALTERMRGHSMQPAGIARSDGMIAPEEKRRLEIIDELRTIGPQSIPALMTAMTDPEVQMRRNATLVLICLAGGYDGKPRMDIKEAIPALTNATEDEDANVRSWAAQALSEIGPDAKQAIPALLILLADENEGPRNSSCMALGNIGPAAQAALPALRKALLSDPSADVREFAQRAIDKISSEDGAEQAVTRSESEDNAPEPQMTPVGTVKALYGDKIFFGLRNDLPASAIQHLSACLTHELTRHLHSCSEKIKKQLAENRDENLKVSLGEGPIFLSNYEHANDFEVGEAKVEEDRAEVTVEFTYTEAGTTYRWVDVAILHSEGDFWLLDDIHFQPKKGGGGTLKKSVDIDTL